MYDINYVTNYSPINIKVSQNKWSNINHFFHPGQNSEFRKADPNVLFYETSQILYVISY